MEFNNNEINCPSGKVYFRTRFEIRTYINNRNKRNGGDGFRDYYCHECGGYHLTTGHCIGSQKLYKNAHKYNRERQKGINGVILEMFLGNN
jgi:hypothetical protein